MVMGLRFSGIVFSMALLVLPSARAECDLDTQRNTRKDSLDFLRIIPIKDIGGSDLEGLFMAIFSFNETSIQAPADSCPDMRYPKFRGFGWLYEIPSNTRAEVIVARDAVSVKGPQGKPRRIESTIDFFVANQKFILETDTRRLRMVVSGPFWRVEEDGERASGLLKTAANDKTQRYIDRAFARSVLCLKENTVDLFVPSERDMEERVIEEECKSAFQVGPAYFESGKNKIETSALSLDRGRRNVLIRLSEEKASEKLYLWSTVSPISRFDTMVMVDAIAGNLEKSIEWAVGLQDRAFLSGPLIFSKDGRPLRLAATNKRTGALLVFFDLAPLPGITTIAGFSLVDATTRQEIMPLTEGTEVDLASVGTSAFNIRADVASDAIIGSMVLELSGPSTTTKTENHKPYFLYGDPPKSGMLRVGTYQLQATVYPKPEQDEPVEPPVHVSFTVVDSTPSDDGSGQKSGDTPD